MPPFSHDPISLFLSELEQMLPRWLLVLYYFKSRKTRPSSTIVWSQSTYKDPKKLPKLQERTPGNSFCSWQVSTMDLWQEILSVHRPPVAVLPLHSVEVLICHQLLVPQAIRVWFWHHTHQRAVKHSPRCSLKTLLLRRGEWWQCLCCHSHGWLKHSVILIFKSFHQWKIRQVSTPGRHSPQFDWKGSPGWSLRNGKDFPTTISRRVLLAYYEKGYCTSTTILWHLQQIQPTAHRIHASWTSVSPRLWWVTMVLNL